MDPNDTVETSMLSHTYNDTASRHMTAASAVNIGERVALPLIIILGLAANAFCLKLLRSNVLRKTYIHKYITLVVSLDILSFVFHIPRVFEHCPISSHAFAVYMTKVNWVIILFLRTFTCYILVFISYDRFWAIWKNEKFQDIKDNDPFKKRMIVMFIWVFISILPAIIMGEVQPYNGNEEMGWMSIPALKKKPETIWGEIYGVYSGTFFVGLPIALVIGLSVGLVLGIFLNKILKEDFNKEKRRTQLRKVGSVLGLNLSFGLLFIPYSALLLDYDAPIETCYRSAFKESLLFGFYCLVLIWSILNGIIFILLNQEYMNECKKMVFSCSGKDSDNELAVNYSTFSSSKTGTGVSNIGVDIKEEGNTDSNNDIKEPSEKDKCIIDEPKITKNYRNNSPSHNTSEAIDLEKGDDTKEPSEKDNCIQDEPESTKDASINPIHNNTSEALDPEKEPTEKDICLKDEPEITKRSSDISLDITPSEVDEPEIKHNSDNEFDTITKSKVDEPDINQGSDDEYDIINKSEVDEPVVKQSSGHEYDVTKAKGTLEDAAKRYTSTASINFSSK